MEGTNEGDGEPTVGRRSLHSCSSTGLGLVGRRSASRQDARWWNL